MILALERTAVRWGRRLALLGGWLLLAVAFLTVADALLRYLVGRPIQGTFEATELFLAVVVFFALPYVGLTDSHVTTDLLTRRLGARGQHAVVALTALGTAALLGLIAVELATLARDYVATGRTTITTRIPVGPVIVAVTVAGFLAAFASLVQAAGATARAIRPGLPPMPSPPA